MQLSIRSRAMRRRLGLTIALTAVLALVLAGTGLANLSGSTFEGNDGNLLVNTTGNTDWCNQPITFTGACPTGSLVPGFAEGLDITNPKADNAFGQGTKEDDPNVTVVTGSIPPNKNDLTRFYIGSEFANNSNFLYLGWERAVNIGAANLDFEINQKTTAGFTGTTTGPVLLNRTAGDLLVTYDFGGSGTPTLGLVKWLTAAHGDSANDCLSANSLPCWGANPTDDAVDGINDNRIDLSAAGFAEGAVNTGSISDPIQPNAPRTLGVGLFGEAAINLTAAGVFPAGTCTAFGSAFNKTRASTAFNAEVKDFIAPQPINISNCGTVNIIKRTNPRGINQDFGFTSTIPNPPAGQTPPTTPDCSADTTPSSFTLNDNGNTSSDSTANTEHCANVPAGSYTVTESTPLPANFVLESLTCTAINGGSGSQDATNQYQANITVVPNSTVTCVYVDKQQLGAIQVTKTRKHAADGPGDHPHAGVSFTVNGVTKQTNANGVACFDGLPFGTYTVHETVPTGYHVDANDKPVTVDNNATCSDNPYVGETVSFHNTPLTDITVSVNSQVDGGTSSTITCVDSGQHTVASGSTGANGDGSATAPDLEPGTYTCTVVVDP
jgi:Prealbumin-like fold domain